MHGVASSEINHTPRLHTRSTYIPVKTNRPYPYDTHVTLKFWSETERWTAKSGIYVARDRKVKIGY